MGISTYYHWNIWIIQPILSPIRVGHTTLERDPFKTASTRKTISKVINLTDAENLNSIGPNVTGEVKRGYSARVYFRNTRPIPEVLYQDIMFQGWHGISVSAS